MSAVRQFFSECKDPYDLQLLRGMKNVNACCHFPGIAIQDLCLLGDVSQLSVYVFDRGHDLLDAGRICFGESGRVLHDRDGVRPHVLQMSRVREDRIDIVCRLLL